jgi:hypothetical protein
MKAAKFAVVEISNVVERPWDARAIGRTSEIPRRLVRTKRDKLPCVPSSRPSIRRREKRLHGTRLLLPRTGAGDGSAVA